MGIAHKIVDEIISDICDRKGLGDEFEMADEKIQQDIRSTWEEIILKHLSQPAVTLSE